MANAAYNIDIGLQADGLIAASKRIEERLGAVRAELAKLPEGSKKVGGLTREINSLNAALQRNTKLQENLVAPVIDKPLEKVKDSAKGARIALTSLSLVAQDLPFGFIGIQNNLPGVIQGFNTLKREAGGLVPALKSLGSSLLGPGGVFLAFSAVTAGITFLIQKYGSLGNAIKVLTSSNQAATIAQLAFNKAVNEGIANSAGESAKINILVNTLTNLKAPLKDRQAAYNELKKIQPEILAGITEENALSGKSAEQIKRLTDQRREYVRLKIQENAITGVLNKNAAEALVLEEKVLSAARQLAATIERTNKLRERSLTAREQETLAVLIEKEKQQTSTLKSLTNEYINLNNVTQDYLDKLNPTVLGTARITKGFKDLADELKSAWKIGETRFSEVTDPGRLLDTDAAWRAYVKGNINIQNNSIDEILRNRNSYRKEEIEDTFLGKKRLTRTDRQVGVVIPENLQKQIGEIKLILSNLEDVKNILTQTFFQPLESAFANLFETGKFGFKAFADAVLQQVKQLVAKLIATGIISLLGNILTGAASGVAGSGLGGRLVTDLFRSLGVGGNQIAAPSFAGVGAGAMAMNGSVSLTLRGSDLVASLNRTNATINRVG
jgi:hypothetical protein